MTETEFELINKTIADAKVDGFELILTFSDGSIFAYEASDGGYSSYGLYDKGEYNYEQ